MKVWGEWSDVMQCWMWAFGLRCGEPLGTRLNWADAVADARDVARLEEAKEQVRREARRAVWTPPELMQAA